ncbi:LbetaH domain-containing protein [Sphingobacterium paludis]|uniref:Putative colanic acid biosynthesis acetyltransferase WcaF n=1 Tax=Sphingobacterium paludis TaxID=1476465 RepID=A0A4R7CYP7_9SPHI|nr:putative colanic acid biosynthesis acetyltransferase [Sphingobacterium paludis]TDS13733.1 putative colanic acid biosynthesis acetyltransferase WcaF [Sphingobacterium paludis]
MSELDIKANRKDLKYSKWVYVKRILWSFAKPFFRYSPRTAFGYRNFILRLFGAKIGKQVHIYASARITFPWNLTIGDWSAIGEHAFIYNLGPVTLGEKVTISHMAHVCAGTHDYTDPSLPLIRPAIKIEDQVWVCASAFIGPGVTVAEGSIIGASAVLTKNTEKWSIYAGNPAKFIKLRVLSNGS